MLKTVALFNENKIMVSVRGSDHLFGFYRKSHLYSKGKDAKPPDLYTHCSFRILPNPQHK